MTKTEASQAAKADDDGPANIWNRMIAPRRNLLDPTARRKTRLANAMILLFCLVLMSGALVLLSYGGVRGAANNSLFTMAGLLLYLYTPERYTQKSILAYLWAFTYVIWAVSFGVETALHVGLLMTPPLLFFLFELKHRWQIAFATFCATAVFVYISLYVPWERPGDMTFWDVITAKAATDFDFTPRTYQYIFNMFAMQTALYFISYTAFAALDRAEKRLADELARSDTLLAAMLPDRIAARLKQVPDATIAESVPDASILFADLSGFTAFAANATPERAIAVLNQLFSHFDDLVERHRLEKVKTIGDAYMVAGGLAQPDTDHHTRMASLALEMMKTSEDLLAQTGLSLRIGLHRGQVTAGVIGQHKPFYDVWGDTVNVASRTETSGLPGKVLISSAFAQGLPGAFQLTKAPDVPISEERVVPAFWLDRAR